MAVFVVAWEVEHGVPGNVYGTTSGPDPFA